MLGKQAIEPTERAFDVAAARGLGSLFEQAILLRERALRLAWRSARGGRWRHVRHAGGAGACRWDDRARRHYRRKLRGLCAGLGGGDRKSTRLNSSHSQISYAVFCLKKKKR